MASSSCISCYSVLVSMFSMNKIYGLAVDGTDGPVHTLNGRMLQSFVEDLGVVTAASCTAAEHVRSDLVFHTMRHGHFPQ